jgi:hypothetical protein
MSQPISFRNYQGEAPMDVQRDNPFPIEAVVAPPPVPWNYYNTATQATFNVKLSSGFLHAIVVNTPLVNGTITIYDAKSAIANQKIGTITYPAALTAGAQTFIYDVKFNVGLTVVVGAANLDITYVYL